MRQYVNVLQNSSALEQQRLPHAQRSPAINRADVLGLPAFNNIRGMLVVEHLADCMQHPRLLLEVRRAQKFCGNEQGVFAFAPQFR